MGLIIKKKKEMEKKVSYPFQQIDRQRSEAERDEERIRKRAQVSPLSMYLLVMDTRADSLQPILTLCFLNLYDSRKELFRGQGANVFQVLPVSILPVSWPTSAFSRKEGEYSKPLTTNLLFWKRHCNWTNGNPAVISMAFPVSLIL